ncbi:MAG: hypothetical protein NT141_02175 [candidate division WWE3 bacterium]|nr:hypothetical protein [candidate division WWE3 bacterium]
MAGFLVMTSDTENNQLKTLIAETQSVAIVASPNAGLDGLYAALALRDLLLSQGKMVAVSFPGPLPEEIKAMPEASEISDHLTESTLVLTLDTGGKKVEKLSYWAEGKAFNISIHPLPRNFDPLAIKSNLQQRRLDLLIILGARRLADLGNFFEQNRREFETSAVLNLDWHLENSRFGTIDVIDDQSKSLCEMLFIKLSQWNWRPTPSAAKFLALGLTLALKNA